MTDLEVSATVNGRWGTVASHFLVCLFERSRTKANIAYCTVRICSKKKPAKEAFCPLTFCFCFWRDGIHVQPLSSVATGRKFRRTLF
ncbi:hypothetical protein SERLA73DRAFT_178072, partial [Serpula lacrymans var. lacrymans S7.3]